MSYTKRTIKDRVATGDNKFDYVTNDGVITLTPHPDSVTEVGTSINKDFLDVYEDYLHAFGTHIDGGNASSVNANQYIPQGIVGTCITVRKDTATNWSSSNPILGAGEIGYDTTNDNFKIGDGTTAWNNLQYVKANFYSNVGRFSYLYGSYTYQRQFIFNSKSSPSSKTASEFISKIESAGFNSSSNLFYAFYTSTSGGSSVSIYSEGFYANGGKLYREINGVWTDITSSVTILEWSCGVAN